MKSKPQNIEELREYVAELEIKNNLLKQEVDALKADNARIEEDYAELHERNLINLEELKKIEKKPYTLLKSRVQKGGKTYDNLYILVGDGSKFAPIAIQLTRWNPKQKNLLLVHAKPASIRRVTLVQDLDKPSVSLAEEGAPAVLDHKDGNGDLF